MTRQEILQDYDIDDNGIIISPGKFEAEMYYVVHYWDLCMESAYDDTVYDEEGDIEAMVFNVTDADRRMFPELENVRQVDLRISDQGFVYLHEIA